MCLQIISQSKKKCCKIMAKHIFMCKSMWLDVVYLGIFIHGCISKLECACKVKSVQWITSASKHQCQSCLDKGP